MLQEERREEGRREGRKEEGKRGRGRKTKIDQSLLKVKNNLFRGSHQEGESEPELFLLNTAVGKCFLKTKVNKGQQQKKEENKAAGNVSGQWDMLHRAASAK